MSATNYNSSMSNTSAEMPNYEILDCASLAERWKVPESWVRDQVRSRAIDPIPHVQFGRYIRFECDFTQNLQRVIVVFSLACKRGSVAADEVAVSIAANSAFQIRAEAEAI